MSTVHNPSQFKPEDYAIFDYVDNKAPEYIPGMPAEAYRLMRAEWEAALLNAFPNRNCFHCEHCGNGNVRYVVAVDHKPTSTRVCFGADCVFRLGFANQQEFKLARLKAKAELGRENVRIWKIRGEWIAAHPGSEEVLARAAKSDNSFVSDVASKLDKYGSLSEAQYSAIQGAMDRDAKFAAEKAARLASPTPDLPIGRYEIEGEVLTIKRQPNPYSAVGTLKMLVKRDDGTKVYGTAPSAFDIRRGDRVKFTALVEASRHDRHYGFFKRPTKLKVLNTHMEIADSTSPTFATPAQAELARLITEGGNPLRKNREAAS